MSLASRFDRTAFARFPSSPAGRHFPLAAGASFLTLPAVGFELCRRSAGRAGRSRRVGSRIEERR